jgi:hypothetical protein
MGGECTYTLPRDIQAPCVGAGKVQTLVLVLLERELKLTPCTYISDEEGGCDG